MLDYDNMEPKTVKIFGVIAVIIGILFTIGAFWAMDQLGGMLVIVLIFGPVCIGIGIYQIVTGKFLGRGGKKS